MSFYKSIKKILKYTSKSIHIVISNNKLINKSALITFGGLLSQEILALPKIMAGIWGVYTEKWSHITHSLRIHRRGRMKEVCLSISPPEIWSLGVVPVVPPSTTHSPMSWEFKGWQACGSIAAGATWACRHLDQGQAPQRPGDTNTNVSPNLHAPSVGTTEATAQVQAGSWAGSWVAELVAVAVPLEGLSKTPI